MRKEWQSAKNPYASMAHAMSDPKSQYNRHVREMARIRKKVSTVFWLALVAFAVVAFATVTWFPIEPLTAGDRLLGQFTSTVLVFFGLFKLISSLVGAPAPTPQEMYLDE